MKLINDNNQIVDITPQLVAELFCNMDNHEQALFFNEIPEIASHWKEKGGSFNDFCFQLQYITNDDGLTLAGRRCMQQIGEYSHWGLVPSIKTNASTGEWSVK